MNKRRCAAPLTTRRFFPVTKRDIIICHDASDADSFKYPAARVSPSDGQLTWLITADAMGNLPIR
jgi:hypothetical protein